MVRFGAEFPKFTSYGPVAVFGLSERTKGGDFQAIYAERGSERKAEAAEPRGFLLPRAC
jgi:hypothetical protein